MQVRRAGEIIQSNTIVTGGGLVILIRMFELAGQHMLLQWPGAWAAANLSAFLGEGEVQMVLGTALVALSNFWRASRLSVVVGQIDDVVAARIEAKLKQLTPPVDPPGQLPPGEIPGGVDIPGGIMGGLR